MQAITFGRVFKTDSYQKAEELRKAANERGYLAERGFEEIGHQDFGPFHSIRLGEDSFATPHLGHYVFTAKDANRYKAIRSSLNRLLLWQDNYTKYNDPAVMRSQAPAFRNAISLWQDLAPQMGVSIPFIAREQDAAKVDEMLRATLKDLFKLVKKAKFVKSEESAPAEDNPPVPVFQFHSQPSPDQDRTRIEGSEALLTRLSQGLNIKL